MLEFYTSYFYHVRFFKSNMLPISTAMFDPQWFKLKPGNRVHKDKRGIVNGINYKPLNPKSADPNDQCRGHDNCSKTPDECEFLQTYRKQLDEINFPAFMSDMNKIADRFLSLHTNKIIVLLFHEPSTNKCSEREVVIPWMRDNGIEISELKYPIKDNYEEPPF